MELTTEQKKELHRALLKAFDRGSLKSMLSLYLNMDLDAEVQSAGLDDQVTELLDKSLRQGWTRQLVEAAWRANTRDGQVPGSARLREFHDRWPVEGPPPPAAGSPAEAQAMQLRLLEQRH